VSVRLWVFLSLALAALLALALSAGLEGWAVSSAPRDNPSGPAWEAHKQKCKELEARMVTTKDPDELKALWEQRLRLNKEWVEYEKGQQDKQKGAMGWLERLLSE
jgi:hypothetical protein